MALRTGYGTGVFSSGKYGLPEVYEGAAADTSTSTTTVSGQRIALGGASDASSATTMVVYQRIQSGAASDTSAAAVTATGYTALAGAVSDTITSSVALYWNRVRPFSASDSAAIDATVISRYKWLDTTVGAVTWADADYREGAA